MRFEGCKILSAGALVQEHVSSRSGSAAGEECGEELSWDQLSAAPSFVGSRFDRILIIEILPLHFLTIYMYVLFFGLVYYED